MLSQPIYRRQAIGVAGIALFFAVVGEKIRFSLPLGAKIETTGVSDTLEQQVWWLDTRSIFEQMFRTLVDGTQRRCLRINKSNCSIRNITKS